MTKDGFIGIDDKGEALKELNTIMASALINKMPAISIKEFELGEVTIDTQTKEITSFSVTLTSLRNVLGSSMTIRPLSDREIISSKTYSIIKTAEKISKNEELQNLSLILLESYTHLVNMEYSAAFILSWCIIEHDLMVRWDKMLDDRRISGKRRNKLRNHLLYKTADRVIEIFNLISEISDDEYSKLMKFRKIRNKVVHEGISPSKEDTEVCFDYAYEIITKKLADLILMIASIFNSTLFFS